MKRCKGCNLLINPVQPYCLAYSIKAIVEKCPCTKCLIKSMCKNMCEKRLELYSDNISIENYRKIIAFNYNLRNGTSTIEYIENVKKRRF